MTADRMFTKSQGSPQWESCKTPPAPSSQTAVLPWLESSTVGQDIGTIPIRPPNQHTAEHSARTACTAKQEKCNESVDPATQQTTPPPNPQLLSQPLPIASPWTAPVRPESPGVAANLLKRVSRARAASPGSVTPSRLGPHPAPPTHAIHQTLAALVKGHHAAPAPSQTPPDKILDCSAAHQLNASLEHRQAASGRRGTNQSDANAGTAAASTPDLRFAISGGLERRRSGSGSRRVKPARARNNTKVPPSPTRTIRAASLSHLLYCTKQSNLNTDAALNARVRHQPVSNKHATTHGIEGVHQRCLQPAVGQLPPASTSA